ncbi:MAG: excinuclease ABC subunit UvrC [Prevotellaceae bacterium]|jgi:excinuclease ABC subunit C|nr:excinuclease ABC subunit UvrC [Prevotellaceae bacterium]
MYYPSEHIKKVVGTLPNLPGVYQYVDIHGNVIYVGKAKNLKKRVSSYFTSKQYDNRKLQILVSKVADLKFVVVNSEDEAFLFENTLIKQFQPRYNINLKDDKTYPSICVKNEFFPRVFYTRQVYNDRSRYFGPYSSSRTVKVLLDFIRELYPLRTCKLKLNPKDISEHKFKSCLELHLGNCLGPCIGKQSLDEYNESISIISSILKGNLSEVKSIISDQMQNAARNLDFELAEDLKQKLLLLDDFQSKSTVVNSSVGKVDVFYLVKEGTLAFCNFTRVSSGAVVFSYTFEISSPLDNNKVELLSYAINSIKEKLYDLNREVIVPFLPDESFEKVEFIIPQRGDRYKLLQLSESNCRAYMVQRLTQIEHTDPDIAMEQRLISMQQDLHLKELPYRIECFDNSNTQGTNPVAACVVFKNGKPSKKDYRHFLVKTVESPNDFASMEEIVYRRYSRLIRENQPLPQLVVIDGGKGQLSAAIKSLEKLDLMNKINIVGLAKRLEEVFLPDDPIPLYLNKNSFTLKILMQIRDEAHRFGITFHRKQRSAKMLLHQLEHVPGIGETSMNKLLKEFKTIARIREAGYDSVALLVGSRQAKALLDYGFFDYL